LQYNAFSNIDITSSVVDLQGWIDSDFQTTFESFFKNKNRDELLVVFEVGSWKGLSACKMAETLKRLQFTNFKIVCIDTWLGAPEFWTSGIDDTTRGISMNFVNGYPSVFYTFTKNIKSLNHHDVIVPFPISSIQAADVLQYYNIMADVIYVDASHEYHAVKDDITAYMKLLKPNGVIFGDDYSPVAWPGVVKAVDEFGTPKVDGVLWSFNM